MKFLLDTHTLLWIAEHNDRLSKNAAELFLNPKNEILLSVASIWEMTIKISIGKLELGMPLTTFVRRHVSGNGIKLLDIRPEHLFRIEELPLHHRDPFDRLLVAQCALDDLTIISIDSSFDRYDIERVW